mmetsp:Transcript_24386/g.67928  ORF Transcript_24386/g.67928 Transcript_24386/m.67928 type:complete len:204 (-) Transcript_24386:100-711(-)
MPQSQRQNQHRPLHQHRHPLQHQPQPRLQHQHQHQHQHQPQHRHQHRHQHQLQPQIQHRRPRRTQRRTQHRRLHQGRRVRQLRAEMKMGTKSAMKPVRWKASPARIPHAVTASHASCQGISARTTEDREAVSHSRQASEAQQEAEADDSLASIHPTAQPNCDVFFRTIVSIDIIGMLYIPPRYQYATKQHTNEQPCTLQHPQA